ncbi:MAG: phosphonopyruvate decarboxylase [SAR324 cluster bacterium]|nr:phosphonopyruvate decarboxylase [SAR324 cluster bacterium]
MIKASQFFEHCKANHFEFFSGTPCSYLKPLINAAIDDSEIRFFDATNEGDAVAVVSGAYLAGKKGVVMFQNSGLGNAVNALTSLSYPFRIPCLLIVTHRGQPGGPPDEPQHELMGQINEKLLDILQIQWEYFPEDTHKIAGVFARINRYFSEYQLPYALLMHDGAIEDQGLRKQNLTKPIGQRHYSFRENLAKPYFERATRAEALKVLLKHKLPGDVLVATTGKTGRELHSLQDSQNHFYLIGSMGCAPALSLGIALNCPQNRVITIDGDGALLMRMGNLASVGSLKPKNFIHLLLDNEAHDSTGGQETISAHISFALIAQACGYQQMYSTDELNVLDELLCNEKVAGPVFIHMRIKKGSPHDLGRPTIKPFEVKERLMRYLSKEMI